MKVAREGRRKRVSRARQSERDDYFYDWKVKPFQISPSAFCEIAKRLLIPKIQVLSQN